jgi:hypothetical protein
MNLQLKTSFLGTIICILSASAFGAVKEISNSEFKNLDLNSLAKEGHGGQSVVCRDQSNKITSAQLLDFFEAPIMYRQIIQESNKSVDSQIDAIARKLENTIYRPETYGRIFNDIKSSITFVKDVKLKLINDSLEVIIPNGCKVEQLAIYVDQNLILVDNEIWEKLSPTHQAGLIVHEGVYFDARVFGEKDSRRTRKIVGHLFSNFMFNFIYDGIPQNAERCGGSSEKPQESSRFDFFMFPEGENTRMQFRQLAGKVVFSKKTILIHRKYPLELENNEQVFGDSEQTESNFEGKDYIGVKLTNKLDAGKIITLKQIELIDRDNNSGTGLIEFTCRPIDFELPKSPNIDIMH